jgi:hypothetical protein
MSESDQEGNILVTFDKAVLSGLHLVADGTDETENDWNIEALPYNEEQWKKIEFERIDANYPNIVFRNVSNFVNKLRLSSSQKSLEIRSLNVFALPDGEMRWNTTKAICWCGDGFELDCDSTATTECNRERWPGTQAFCQPIGLKLLMRL